MANGSGIAHPLRRSEVRDEIERLTRAHLDLNGGTGKISIVIDFKAWKPISWHLLVEDSRRDLTDPT